ncbi:MAG: hypothetical protein K2N06_08755 [Oscillospiraceae bacterium]|nr:hypothetical protein [Oscillospiraceae bacterium]
MKKRIIIPIAVIAAVIAVSVLTITLYKPVEYRDTVRLGGDKLTVEIRDKKPFEAAYMNGREYNLRVIRDGKSIINEDFYYADKTPINSEFVKVNTGAEENADIEISRGYGRVILRVEIRGDSVKVTHNDD